MYYFKKYYILSGYFLLKYLCKYYGVSLQALVKFLYLLVISFPKNGAKEGMLLKLLETRKILALWLQFIHLYFISV